MKVVIDVRFLQTYMLVFLRVGCIVLFAPMLGPRGTPWMLKFALTLICTALVAPFVPPAPPVRDLLSFGGLVAREAFIGMVLGFSIRLIFGAIQTAGQIIGYQMGFSMVNLLDPHGHYPIPILSHFITMLAILIFLQTNGHHWYLAALVRSYEVVGMGEARFSGRLGWELLSEGGEMFVAAVKIGFPLLAIIFLFYVVMALVARAMPQMNVFIVALPMQVGLGLIVLMLSLPFIASYMEKMFLGLWRELGLLLKAMG